MNSLGKGSEFAGYRVGEIIGYGGMGIVYEAVHIQLDRPVALKVISPGLASDETFRNRFVKEARAAASLHHPHVVTVHDAGEEQGLLYLVMERVVGEDFRAVLRSRGRLSVGDANLILAPIADALDSAHELGLVHRDVKPANILVKEIDGRKWSYLTDFGLTRHVESGHSLTGTGEMVGTLDYVAPEQVTGGEIDRRVDVYALACVYFESLSGRVPFDTEAGIAKMWAQVNTDPPRLDEVLQGASEQLSEVLLKGMAKDRDDRFDCAGDLALAVSEAISEPVGGGRTYDPVPESQETVVGVLADSSGRTSEVFENGVAEAGEQDEAVGTPGGDRSRIRWLGLACIAVLALASGILLGLLKSPGDKTSEHVKAGNLRVSFKEPWVKYPGSDPIPGLDLSEPIRLNDETQAGLGKLRAGQVVDPGPPINPIPEPLHRRFVKGPTHDRVLLGGKDWDRYEGRVHLGEAERWLSLLMINTTTGFRGLACEGPNGLVSDFPESCASVSRTVQLVGVKPVDTVPSAKFAEALGDIQSELKKAEGKAASGLAADDSSTQSHAARLLAGAYGDQSKQFEEVAVPGIASGPSRALASALRSSKRAYAALAGAAGDESESAYSRAAEDVRDSAEEYSDALARFRPLGYQFRN